MRGVKIDFSGGVPVFDFTDTVKDFDATVQNVMVNFGTNLGSDPVFSDRGTYLMSDALQGRMVNLQWSNNAANFAALRTTVFSQAHEIPGNEFGLQSLTLSASSFNIYRLRLDLTAKCINGETRGETAAI